MYFGGIRNIYSTSTPNLPHFFYSHIEAIETFRATYHQLAMKLLRCFAISFGLGPDYFVNGTNLSSAEIFNDRTQRNCNAW
jgi:isopenicillin N synthase-like dioxygenase